MASGSPDCGTLLPARTATPSARLEHFGIKPKVPGKCFIQPDEARCGDGGGWQTRKQALRQPGVAVIEGKDVSCFSWGEHFVSRKGRQIVGAGNH